jgi:hypothetical protein
MGCLVGGLLPRKDFVVAKQSNQWLMVQDQNTTVAR